MRAAAERGRSEKSRLEQGHGREGTSGEDFLKKVYPRGNGLVKPVFSCFFATGLDVSTFLW